MSPTLDAVFEKYRADISLPETEDSWERIAKAFIALKTCCQDGQFSSTEQVVQMIRSIQSPINNALLSERTRLSAAATDLVTSVATACEADFESLFSQFMPTLMILTGRTNKVVITRTKTCIFTIIDYTHSPLLLAYFQTHLQEKSATMRLISAQCTLAYLKCCNPPDVERESRAIEVESIIRKTARDANADVRKVGREIFGAYKLLLPTRVDKFTAPLTPTIRKYLDIKAAAPSVPAKPALPKMKSMTALAAAAKEKEREKRPVAGHSRTNSNASNSTSTKGHDRNPTAGRADVRPASSMASIQPTRPVAPEKRTVTTSKPESSRQALFSSGSSTGPSRVLSTSADAPKQPVRTRTAPTSTAVPQRSLSRPVAPSSSASSLASSGPRRVPVPDSSQSTGPVMQKRPERPISRPASQQSQVQAPARPASQQGQVRAPTRPASQQSRPIKAVTNPAPKATTSSRAMPPPKTRADGSALGSAAPVKRPVAAASTSGKVANVEPRPPRPRAGLSQPTASQLAKVKALVINKNVPKKVEPLAARPPTKPASSNVLSKSSKANVPPSDDETKTSKAAKVPPKEPAADIPLPPSPVVEPAEIPLPEAACRELEEQEVVSVTTPVQEQVEVELPAEAEEAKLPSAPIHYNLPLLGPKLYVDGEELSTPMHPEVKSLGWNNAKTPISALLSSIQQGFEFSPASPVSPPYTYVSGDKDTSPLATQLF